MQNFFTESRNNKRKTPCTCSGMTLDGEVRVKVEGASIRAIKYTGYVADGNDISLAVEVINPVTGEVAFNDTFTFPKK